MENPVHAAIRDTTTEGEEFHNEITIPYGLTLGLKN